MKHRIEEWIGASIGIVIVLPIMGSIGLGALSILWQCIKWLELATWPSLTFRHGLAWWLGPMASHYVPQTGYLGVDRIFLWVLDSTPLAIWLIVICPLLWMLMCAFFYGGLFSIMRSRKAR